MGLGLPAVHADFELILRLSFTLLLNWALAVLTSAAAASDSVLSGTMGPIRLLYDCQATVAFARVICTAEAGREDEAAEVTSDVETDT